MKIKILIGVMILTYGILGWVVFVNAQTTPININVANGQVQKAKQEIDSSNQNIVNDQTNILQNQAVISTDQSGLISSATQTPPLQSAVDLCNSNISLYCPGYTPPTCMASGIGCMQNTDCCSGTCNNGGINWTSGVCQ